jgi:hypothetical protein
MTSPARPIGGEIVRLLAAAVPLGGVLLPAVLLFGLTYRAAVDQPGQSDSRVRCSWSARAVPAGTDSAPSWHAIPNSFDDESGESQPPLAIANRLQTGATLPVAAVGRGILLLCGSAPVEAQNGRSPPNA